VALQEGAEEEKKKQNLWPAKIKKKQRSKMKEEQSGESDLGIISTNRGELGKIKKVGGRGKSGGERTFTPRTLRKYRGCPA